MGSYSLLRLSFVISLCIHFSLGFLPCFTPPQAHQSPSKFMEVVFSKVRKNKVSAGDKKKIAENNPVELKKANRAADVCAQPIEKKYYEETNDKKVIIAEQFELDLINLEGNCSSNLFFDYAHLLRACIQKEIIYPSPAFNQNIQGRVQLKFILLPDGNLKNVYIVESSNYLILDTAAINAIEKANPFPPFPGNLRAKELFVKVPIIYKPN
ncbi:MAG: energy transducer TonB [Candidatus Ratteibacteria bacterium]|nr:energy transducer TonB [Candidatus Ratteibacteria bacterium]